MIIDPLSENFKKSGLWQRLLEHVGGNEQSAIRWWDTPLGCDPFFGRTPRDLMTANEWDTVRVFLESRNPVSGAIYNYGISDQYIGMNPTQDMNSLNQYYYTKTAEVVYPKTKRPRK